MKFLYFYSLVFLESIFSQPVNAQLLSGDADGKLFDQSAAMAESSGFSEDTSADFLPETIAVLIKTFLGFLGIIFIILIIWSGYNWMTAGGNEEKVTKARTTIFRAIIGIIITVSAYAITFFIFGALNNATTGP